MRTIGLLGGMSWESSALYYRRINEFVRERLGGQHNARSLMLTVDFAEIEEIQRRGEWDAAGATLAAAAGDLERAGADLIVLCTNTMHRVAGAIEDAIAVPFLHIGDACGEVIKDDGRAVVGLLGTRFTLEGEFYAARLRERFGLEVLIPEKRDRDRVHSVIYEELTIGQVREASREEFVAVIERLGGRGADRVLLGCTEIGLLVAPSDSPLPLYDGTEIHSRRAVELALG